MFKGTSLNITGSIAQGSTMRVYRAANGGSLTHRGCLRIHPLQSAPSLLEEIAPAFFAQGRFENDSALSPSFVPTASSRALDG